jgi:hypothetical protein
MRKLTHLLIVVLFVLTASSCLLRKKQDTTDYSAQDYKKALVIDYAIDGCKWMLRLENDNPTDDNKKLEPDYIMPEFQQDSLPVWIKYEQEDRMSICMAGETIKLISIKKR